MSPSGGALTSFRLSDDRTLAFEDVGGRSGFPVFYLHGIPSSGSEWRLWGTEALLKRTGVRLLAVDRPGVGGSSYDPGRTVASTGADLAELATGLDLDRFAVIGYSGGAAYGMALALDPRCVAAAVVAGVLPPGPGLTDGLDRQSLRYLELARSRFGVFGLAYRGTVLMWRHAPQRFVDNALASFGAADRAEFSRPEVHRAIMATRGSPRGQRLDVALAISPWGLALHQITAPVQIWQGTQDHNASPAMARALAASIPGSQLTVIDGEGHISLPVRHAERILLDLQANAAHAADPRR